MNSSNSIKKDDSVLVHKTVRLPRSFVEEVTAEGKQRREKFSKALRRARWELYCRSVQFLQTQGSNAAKLFESESVSFTLSLQPIVRRPTPSRPRPLPGRPPAAPQRAPPQQPQPKNKTK